MRRESGLAALQNSVNLVVPLAHRAFVLRQPAPPMRLVEDLQAQALIVQYQCGHVHVDAIAGAPGVDRV